MNETLFAEYRKWSACALQEEGIVVAADAQQEWLLPWWWEKYSRLHTHPVAFVDFGLSKPVKKWCEERGMRIALPVPDIFVASREEMDPDLVAHMEKEVGKKFWPCRDAWFKKPLACLLTPFKKSIWIDLDCEIRGSLQPLFELKECSLGLVKYRHTEMPYPVYNSGLIVFEQGIPVFEKWADLAIEQNHLFRGDEEILSYLLHTAGGVFELPAIYNWSRCFEENAEAIVMHWHGANGKFCIYHQMMASNLDSFVYISS
jgi:hypothetical protein